jgi:hypothetical protein
MSDVEHELIVDNLDLQVRVDRISVIALRSIAAAAEAQEVAFGEHEEWLDDARRAVAS